MSDDFSPSPQVRRDFIKWIEQPCFDSQHAVNWAHLYNKDPQAAMCEATFWAVLASYGVEVLPNRDLKNKRSPDFLCSRGGRRFYVETTCILKETVTRRTSLPDAPEGGARNFRLLNEAIFKECQDKGKKDGKRKGQCDGLDAPCILAVGTFHAQATALCIRRRWMEWLLTGEPTIALCIDTKLGKAIGDPYQVTQFESSVFTRVGKLQGLEPTRQPLSALLVGGFGLDAREPVRLFGLLNPSPTHELDPQVLDRVPFCRQRIDLSAGTVSAEWVQGGRDEDENDD